MKKLIFLFLVLFFANLSHADKKHGRHHIHGVEVTKIDAMPATRANISLGQPYWVFPEPWGELTVVSSGALNPVGEKALPLQPGMPGDTVIVSRFDDILSGFPTQFPENIPSHERRIT